MNRTEHLLTCLIEECAEVQKEATKALRFGILDKYKQGETCAEGIAHEVCDLVGIIRMLHEEGIIPDMCTDETFERRRGRTVRWMEYAINSGALQID